MARLAPFWSVKVSTLTGFLPALVHFLLWAVESAATVSVRFDFTAAGTSEATFLSTPGDAVVFAPVEAGVEVVLLFLLPQPARMAAVADRAARQVAKPEILRVMQSPPQCCPGED